MTKRLLTATALVIGAALLTPAPATATSHETEKNLIGTVSSIKMLEKSIGVHASAKDRKTEAYGYKGVYLSRMVGEGRVIRGNEQNAIEPGFMDSCVGGMDYFTPQILCDPLIHANDRGAMFNTEHSGATFKNPEHRGYAYIVFNLRREFQLSDIELYQMYGDGETTHAKVYTIEWDRLLWPSYDDPGWTRVLSTDLAPIVDEDGNDSGEVYTRGDYDGYTVAPAATADLTGSSSQFVLVKLYNDRRDVGKADWIELGGIKLFGSLE